MGVHGAQLLQDSAPPVRAEAGSLTWGLLQVVSARSSATLSTFTATKKVGYDFRFLHVFTGVRFLLFYFCVFSTIWTVSA